MVSYGTSSCRTMASRTAVQKHCNHWTCRWDATSDQCDHPRSGRHRASLSSDQTFGSRQWATVLEREDHPARLARPTSQLTIVSSGVQI
jgi:hypothetical protein